MAFRFRRSFKIAPGIRLNLNSKSTSVRLGPKGLGYTISSTGKKRVTASIPGTGISHTQTIAPARRQPPPSVALASSEQKKRGSFWPFLLTAVVIVFAIGLFNKPVTKTAPATSSSSMAAPAPVDKPSLVPEAPQSTTTTSARPVSPAPAAVETALPAVSEYRYVTATSLNVRSSPSTEATVMAKVTNSEEIAVLRSDAGWLLIQLSNGVQGWVSEQYTSRTKAALQPIQPIVSAPAQDRDTIVRAIISQSIVNYSGACPCPYNTMRSGRRCGGNSAYSKPGGRSPICFANDVTEAMIAAFRP